MAGLGRDFNRLWGAAAVNNLGDGIVAAAAPLLVASVTSDPLLVGFAAFAQQLPWLLFSLVSGVYVDRLDRRRLIVVVNVIRATVVGGLTLVVALWHEDAVPLLPAVYVAGFLLGTCETLADNASSSLVPTVVASEDLPRANARMMGAFFVINRFVAPPLGAAFFVVAAALPFGVNAVTFVLAGVLIAGLRRAGGTGPDHAARPATPGEAAAGAPGDAPPAARPSLRADIAEGVRWLWSHPAIRMISVSLLLMNITLFSGLSILVLYGQERLGLGEMGYGLFLTSFAIGGLAGALWAPRLQARFSPSLLLRVGLVIETLTHVGLALASTVWAAGAVIVVFGIHGSVWMGVEKTLRQRAVPDRLRGRVEGVFFMFVMGGAALGSFLGGPVARWLGVTGPFWLSAVVMVALTVVAWRPFGRVVDAKAPGTARVVAGGGTLEEPQDHTRSN
ncbi:MFS transporter [Streptomyces sp. 4N509B]|uniref:MFS transporter n=1 Tax=Streptomyces sp. 4N509B TaxID=3457413 RepID=UPI003FD63D9A